MMINYKALKHSDNGMTTWDVLLGPTLSMASTKKRWKLHNSIQSGVQIRRVYELYDFDDVFLKGRHSKKRGVIYK